MSKVKTMGSVIANGSKVAGPASGLIGALSDAFSPLAPFAPILNEETSWPPPSVAIFFVYRHLGLVGYNIV